MHKAQLLLMAGLMAMAPGYWGCSDAPDESTVEDVGSVEMQLSSTGSSGTTYRLRNALFSVARESDGAVVGVLDSEVDPDAALVTGDFPAGGYSVTLQPGWSLDRVDTGATVAAELISSATQPVVITTGLTRTLVYKFRADDESIVFGGSLAIAIKVCGEDGLEPNDSETEASFLPFNQTVLGAICPSDDFFSFNQGIFATDFIQLDFQHSQGDLDLYLTLPDGTVLSSETVSDQERIEFPANQSGVHTVRVTGFNGATGSYSLLHGEVVAAP